MPRKPKISYLSWLFIFFCAYTVAPFIDIPVIGLSLSAPMFYFITLELFLGRHNTKSKAIRGWGFLAFIIGFGIFISFFGNGVETLGETVNKYEILTLIRYVYWLLVFYITAVYLLHRPEIATPLVNTLGWMVFALALARWYEGIVLGKIGAWSGVSFMTQNEYAWLFSSNTAFLYPSVTQGRRKDCLVGWVLVLIVLGAVVINGSRSSWIALVASSAAYIGAFLVANPKSFRTFIKLFFLAAFLWGAGWLALTFGPEKVRETFIGRFSTFETLDTDKSYQIRQVQIQKGKKIFKMSPLVGCGPGRFRSTQVDLDLPKVLLYQSEEYFNHKSAHNSYIQYVAETGLAGTIPYVILLLALGLRGFRAAIHLAKMGWLWGVSVYASFIGMSIHLWSLAGLTNTAPWLKYGMLAAVIAIDRQLRIQIWHERQSSSAPEGDPALKARPSG